VVVVVVEEEEGEHLRQVRGHKGRGTCRTFRGRSRTV